jgi:hypothetical protein
LDCDQIQTWPAKSYDVSIYQMCATLKWTVRNLKISNFFLFKRDNCVKNQQNIFTCTFLWQTHICNLNLIHVCIQTKVRERKLKIFIFYFKFKRDNSVKNQWTITKFVLDLRIPIMNIHMQFDPYTYIQTKVGERKISATKQKLERGNWNFFPEG